METEKLLKDSEKIYTARLFEDIENIKRALQFYVSENKKLENELNFYKNAYENRVNEYLKKGV